MFYVIWLWRLAMFTSTIVIAFSEAEEIVFIMLARYCRIFTKNIWEFLSRILRTINQFVKGWGQKIKFEKYSSAFRWVLTTRICDRQNQKCHCFWRRCSSLSKFLQTVWFDYWCLIQWHRRIFPRKLTHALDFEDKEISYATNEREMLPLFWAFDIIWERYKDIYTSSTPYLRGLLVAHALLRQNLHSLEESPRSEVATVHTEVLLTHVTEFTGKALYCFRNKIIIEEQSVPPKQTDILFGIKTRLRITFNDWLEGVLILV